MRNALEKLVISAIILASGHTAVYAHPSEASCQLWQNSGHAATNLLLIASEAQPLTLLGGLTAGLLTWNGPGSFKLPPPPAPEEGLVANAAAVGSPKVAQRWAVGPEAPVLTSMKPAAPIAPHVVAVAPPVYRAPPPALEF